MKTCPRCKRDLPLDAFTKDGTRKDGLAYRCRACEAIRVTERRANPKPKPRDVPKGMWLTAAEQTAVRRARLGRAEREQQALLIQRGVEYLQRQTTQPQPTPESAQSAQWIDWMTLRTPKLDSYRRP